MKYLDFREVTEALLLQLERIPIVVLAEYAPDSFLVIVRARHALHQSEDKSK